MDKIKQFFQAIPSKKSYIEFITAILSIPVLLTVIALNWSNLTASKNTETQQEKPSQIIISSPEKKQEEEKEITPTTTVCKKGVGDISITSPQEGATVSTNPVSVTISYDAGEFCDVVWSYRVNDGAWSEYDNKSFALYNLSSGDISIQLRVKSIVSGGGEKIITRNFTYESTQRILTPTPTVTPTLSETPTLTPTQQIQQ